MESSPDTKPQKTHLPWYQKAWRFIQELKSEPRARVARIGASALLVTGGVFSLSFARVGWRLELGYIFLASALVCFAEINWRRNWPEIPPHKSWNPPPWPLSEEETQARWKDEQHQKHEQQVAAYEMRQRELRRRRSLNRQRSIVEIVFLIALAVGTAFLGHRFAAPPEKLVTQNLSSEDHSSLLACHNDLAQARLDLQACRAEKITDTLKVNPTENLQDQLQRYFAAHPTPASAPPPSPLIALNWGWVVLGIIALIILGSVAKKHKEVVPVAGAAGLATDALKHANELARMNKHMYVHVLWTFLGISGALILLFLVAAAMDLRKRATGDAQPESSAADLDPAPDKGWWYRLLDYLFSKKEAKPENKENYISSLGFSVLVLLWAAVMVGFKAEPTRPQPPPPPAPPHVAEKTLQPVRLAPLSPFQQKFATLEDGKQLEPWVKEISAQTHKGDMLLLLGSTDCKAYNNPELAQERANQAKRWLTPVLQPRGVTLESISIKQQDRCRESKDLRAVYPFLITNGSPNAASP